MLSADQLAVQEKEGRNWMEPLTEFLFIGTLKVMVILVLSGISGPMGVLLVTKGRMKVVKFQA